MIHMIGNAHIDPVWLWDWREGYAEVAATFRSALDRLNEFDGFLFTCACADYYRFVEESAPDMFEEIRARVKQGRWVIAGGMWIQPDCNMPSGESFVRQLLYSQRYFTEKFGKAAVTGYNVDSFGHCATIPQLLNKAGMYSYVFLRPGVHENADIPSGVFNWYSPDGSFVTAFHIPDSYGNWGFGNIESKINAYRDAEAKAGISHMCFYGVGNHGGGPTIENLRGIDAYRKDCPDSVVYSSPDAYFEEIRMSGVGLTEWRRELQHHASGCYSANSVIKRLNRKTETALFQAERFAVLANKVSRFEGEDMKRGFYNLMFNQFHDLLCGCCIMDAYSDAENQLGESASIAARVQNMALRSIARQIDTSRGLDVKCQKDNTFALWQSSGKGAPIIAFNSNAFETEGPIRVMGHVARVTDDAGANVDVQTVRALRTNGNDKWDTLFTSRVPPLGWQLYWAYTEAYEDKPTPNTISIGDYSIENSRLRVGFDCETGAISSIYIKDAQREILALPALIRMIDIEHCDTWAHGIFTFDKEAGVFSNAAFEILEKGPVRAKLRVTSVCSRSTLIQEFTVYADSDQIEVSARLDMRDEFRMVKMCFPTGLTDAVTRCEIAYGAIEREMSGREDTCQRYVDIGTRAGGLSVINDCKYSFSAQSGELRLTVANTSIYADHFGQLDRDATCRHMDMGEQTFGYAIVPRAGDLSEMSLSRRAEAFHNPIVGTTESYHRGNLPQMYSGMSIDAKNVSLGALKRAESGEGCIVRFVETEGRACSVCADMPLLARKLKFPISPWEIKTFIVPDDGNDIPREVLLTEYPID